MAKGIKNSEEDLKKWYNRISRILMDNDNEPMTMDEISTVTGLNKSKIAAALKYGRNRLAFLGRFPFWITGTPKGLKRVSNKHGEIDEEHLIAYAIQNVKDINSRVNTQAKLYDYVVENYYDELVEGFKKAKMPTSSTGARLEINPWEVYRKIMEGYGHEFGDDNEYYGE